MEKLVNQRAAGSRADKGINILENLIFDPGIRITIPAIRVLISSVSAPAKFHEFPKTHVMNYLNCPENQSKFPSNVLELDLFHMADEDIPYVSLFLTGKNEHAWNGLLGCEKTLKEWLLAELMRLQRLEHLANKFKHMADILPSQDYNKYDMIFERKAMKKKSGVQTNDAFESDLAAHQDRVEQIAAIAQEHDTLEYWDSAAPSTHAARRYVT